MSRVGRAPLVLPPGVTLHVADARVRAEGPKGKLERSLDGDVTVTVEGNAVRVTRRDDSRRAVRDKLLLLTLGYSHPIAYQLPPEVTAKVDKQVVVTLASADNELLGHVAAAIRELRPPEPYKGKGVKYAEEKIRRKAGKAAAAAGGAR
ncbi:MAG: 50S ribosomal protein L6 [Deltaproteobacteria bacterium]|nr:MAG: 50S ribosomal protein L6 [Deltaproteobacteria bacterium]